MSSGFVMEKGLDLSEKYKRVVMVSGNFNILHPGHLRLLHFAKSCGDFLLVVLLKNNMGTFVDFEDRKATLLELGSVDKVVGLEEKNILEFIKATKPSVLVKGKEHEFSSNIEREVLASYGGKLIFGSGEIQFSSLDLIRKEFLEPNFFILKKAKKFVDKHQINFGSLIEKVETFKEKKILVVGDVILDEYVYCDPLGMSQEDPTIVVTPVDKKFFLGGAGIVSAHLVGLGAKASFLSVVGNDKDAIQINKYIEKYGIDGHLVIDESRSTILKQRFRSGNKTLLRVNYLRSHDIGEECLAEMLHNLVRAIDDTQLLIFSDFNYGCLPQGFVENVIKICNDRGIPYFADSQASSQLSDVSRFHQATCVCATEREARLSLNDFKSGLQKISENLIKKARANNIIIKLGAEGLIALQGSPESNTDTLPALNSHPSDVAGAGDALLAASSLLHLAGGNIFESALVGSIAAGIQVSRIGNLPLSLEDMLSQLHKMK